MKSLSRDYDNLITMAVIGYKMNPELFRVCRPWVESQIAKEGEYWHGAEDTLGYAELRDDIDIHKILTDIAENVRWHEIEGPEEYQDMLDWQRQNPTKAYARRILKAYYLMGNPE